MTARRDTVLPVRLAIAGIALGASVTLAGAQNLSHYRTYVLGSSLTEVTAAAGTRSSDLKTRYERPVLVQQIEWRAPYNNASTANVDPVEAITFAFVQGQLYQLNVTYSRDLTKGLTPSDLVSALTDVYGAPALGTSRRVREATTPVLNTAVLARWNDAETDITLTRGPYGDLELVVRSKELGGRATAGIQAALALDAAEAPLRRQQALESQAADDLAERTRNKAGFKP